MTSPSRFASRVEREPAVRALARVGIAAIGLLHILIGAIALAVAFGAGGNADQSGALQAIVAVPGGLFALGAVIVGLIFLSVWQLLQSITAHRRSEKLVEVAKFVVYAILAGAAISIAAGARKNSSASEQSASGKLLGTPGGVFLLAAIGLVVVAVGIDFLVNGVTRRFERDLRLPPDRWATITAILGRVGYIAKGIALVIVGGLVTYGAITSDPKQAGGLDGSLKELTKVPFGVVLLVLIAIGLIAYGVFWCVRAFASRLKEQ